MTGRVKVLSWQLEVVCISDRRGLTIPGSLALQSAGFNLSNFGKRGIFGDVLTCALTRIRQQRRAIWFQR